jgi:Family of unknown function (DUF5678)
MDPKTRRTRAGLRTFRRRSENPGWKRLVAQPIRNRFLLACLYFSKRAKQRDVNRGLFRQAHGNRRPNVATLTETQQRRLGGRSLEAALTDARTFEKDSRLLFSREIAASHCGKWVAVRDGKVVAASNDFDDLLAHLKAADISAASCAIAYIESKA